MKTKREDEEDNMMDDVSFFLVCCCGRYLAVVVGYFLDLDVICFCLVMMNNTDNVKRLMITTAMTTV